MGCQRKPILIHCQKILIDFYRPPYAVPIPPTPKSFAATGFGGTKGAANFCPDWSDRIFVFTEWTADDSSLGRSPDRGNEQRTRRSPGQLPKNATSSPSPYPMGAS